MISRSAGVPPPCAPGRSYEPVLPFGLEIRVSMPKDERERIHGLDFLRGVASLAVCWFHLTSFTYATPDGWFYSALRRTGTYGWLGVEVFFVISGFVIPYSLHRAKYS